MTTVKCKNCDLDMDHLGACQQTLVTRKSSPPTLGEIKRKEVIENFYNTGEDPYRELKSGNGALPPIDRETEVKREMNRLQQRGDFWHAQYIDALERIKELEKELSAVDASSPPNKE